MENTCLVGTTQKTYEIYTNAAYKYIRYKRHEQPPQNGRVAIDKKSKEESEEEK